MHNSEALDELNRLSNELLHELDSDQPDISHLAKLYSDRGSYIDILRENAQRPNRIPEKHSEEFSQLMKKFHQITEIDKIIREKLSTFRDQLRTELEELARTKKATQSYRTSAGQKERSFFINRNLEG